MSKIVFEQVVRRKGRRISVEVFHSRGCKHALSCQALPLLLLKRSAKCKEIGGEVCFVSRLADKMYQVTCKESMRRLRVRVRADVRGRGRTI